MEMDHGYSCRPLLYQLTLMMSILALWNSAGGKSLHVLIHIYTCTLKGSGGQRESSSIMKNISVACSFGISAIMKSIFCIERLEYCL